ncbi:MAG: Mrp/NBP35 family ATP-binding protein [Candidatus Zixiibacteriota bacterium]|nr:MAG: Mrp/NBP35 family ATP-binding protein [candidate division Zixibacteria bacterium]
MSNPDEQTVRRLLGEIQDPELGRSLTELNMVRSVSIVGSDVSVVIAVTVPGCPLKDKIKSDIVSKIKTIQGVETVRVEFGVMNPEELERLRSLLGAGSLISQLPDSISSFATRCIAICSGKGGVGKSTITANLAAGLTLVGRRVAVLDADVYGFSIPRMLGVSAQPSGPRARLEPQLTASGIQVMSMGFFVSDNQPVIWRGPLLHKAIQQFLTDTIWQPADFLLLDLPPGTGDVTLTIAQSLPNAELLIITTPQLTATDVAGRVAQLANRYRLRLLGVVENMAFLNDSGQRQYIFGKDGGKRLAESLNTPLLAQIPILETVCHGADSGQPVAQFGSHSERSLFENLARMIDAQGSA